MNPGKRECDDSKHEFITIWYGSGMIVPREECKHCGKGK